MQELFCFVITPQDYKEMLTALARCPGSRTRAAIRRQALLLWPIAGLMLLGLWLARVLDGRQLVGAAGFAALLLFPVSLSAPWRFVKKRMAAFCRAKAGPGAEGVEQRIFLQDGQYFHQAEGQACSGIPLAALREARPGAPGGAVLLFNTGAEDYLPLRLFGPQNPVPDFCRRMNELAAAARQAPRTLEDAAGPADTPGAAYRLCFSLSGEQAVRLLSVGSCKLYFAPERWKSSVPRLLLLCVVLAAECLLLSPAAALCVGAVAAIFLLGPGLAPISRAIWQNRLRRGRLDSLLGPQQAVFYEDALVLYRVSGEYRQQYRLFSRLIDTPDAWYLAERGAQALLILPKEALPAEQHAAFAGFLRARLGGG